MTNDLHIFRGSTTNCWLYPIIVLLYNYIYIYIYMFICIFVGYNHGFIVIQLYTHYTNLYCNGYHTVWSQQKDHCRSGTCATCLVAWWKPRAKGARRVGRLLDGICFVHIGGSQNGGTPISFILMIFPILNHPFWRSPIMETPIWAITKITWLIGSWEFYYQSYWGWW